MRFAAARLALITTLLAVMANASVEAMKIMEYATGKGIAQMDQMKAAVVLVRLTLTKF